MTMPVRTREDDPKSTAVERGDNPASPATRGRFTTWGSFACLALLAPWLVFCYIALKLSDPLDRSTGFLWLGIFIVGVCVLAFVGTALGLAATPRTPSWRSKPGTPSFGPGPKT